MRSGSRLLSEKMQSRCAFSWRFAGPEKLPALHKRPKMLFTHNKSARRPSALPPGQELNRVKFRGFWVGRAPMGENPVLPLNGLRGYWVAGPRAASLQLLAKAVLSQIRKWTDMSCCFCCAAAKRRCLLQIWSIALSASFLPLPFASSGLFVFQQLVSWGWRWRKIFLQIDDIFRQVPQAGRC